ncbi:MAG TPA: phosphatidylglycerophosphatase A [Terriglobales bacterium]|nr:phosphatidylglycerophosphatase A [Terriglobales bacterium]
MQVERKIILTLATGLGVGYFPLFPGTLGTLLALPLSIALNRLATASLLLGLLALGAFIGSAVWVSTRSERYLARKDPQNIVIDEIAGFLLANFLAPPAWIPWSLAFVFFRLFDIVKVFPAARLQNLPGGLGVVSDDLLAGFYTLAILRIIDLVALR